MPLMINAMPLLARFLQLPCWRELAVRAYY